MDKRAQRRIHRVHAHFFFYDLKQIFFLFYTALIDNFGAKISFSRQIPVHRKIRKSIERKTGNERDATHNRLLPAMFSR